MRTIPFLLTMLRLSLAPLMVLAALGHQSPWLFLAYLSLAFVSDIFDGILGRRFNVVTDRLRRLDSLTDIVFYSSVFIAIWIVDPRIIRADAAQFAGMVGLELLGQILALVLGGKPAAVHSYMAKAWGVCLFLASCEVLVGGGVGILFRMMVVVGFIMYAEWISIILLTRGRAVDVASIFSIWRSGQRIQMPTG